MMSIHGGDCDAKRRLPTCNIQQLDAAQSKRKAAAFFLPSPVLQLATALANGDVRKRGAST
jgi:hypothetical protein